MSSFIDIHTHHNGSQPDLSTFRLHNVIVSLDEFEDMPCSVGVHPWYIIDEGTAQLDRLNSILISRPENLLAIGECGLDKLIKIPIETQETVFKAQLLLSQTFSKPVIIHCVRAYQEIIRLVKESQITVPIVMHGFNRSIGLAQQLLGQGYYLSLGAGILGGRQDQLIREIPLPYLFLETDSSPVSISEIYMYFCRVRNITLHDLQQQIKANFDTVFN